MVPGFVFSAIAIILLSHSELTVADSIRGCGGFLEASSALIRSKKIGDAKLDFSHVTVELRTLDGLVKDLTQCAPNGYYFIPVYDKGSYIIKVRGPEGWTFNPEQASVPVNDIGCNGNEDINFQFTGFTLYGRVVGATVGDSCLDNVIGPSGVNVELLSLGGDILSSVSTSSTGSYSFKNTIPGHYKLRASRSDLNIKISGSDEVELGFNNAMVNDIFHVTGYNIRGYVVAEGNPILGVHFFLYSENDMLELNCTNDSISPPKSRKALCHTASDADGMFKFTEIPCGTYEIIPFYKGENTIFDVSPSSMLVSVHHDHIRVPQTFQVTGFSIGGRVVDGNGIGVGGAIIMVDENERSVTDKDGYYKLDQVTSKTYNIEATKKYYKFERLNDFLVLPNMPSINDIKAISYSLCGVAQTFGSTYKAKVTLTHGPENVKPQVTLTDDNGDFCFEVQRGEYRLFASAATPESTSELLFSPPYIDVLVDRPVLDVTFSQAQANVNGSVVCIDKCQSSVSVTLMRLDSKAVEDQRTISLSDHSNDFSFSNVLPGKYRIEARNYLPGVTWGEDAWCWKQNFVDFIVGVDDVEKITFVQSGYSVNINSSGEVDAYLIQGGNSRLDLTIKVFSRYVSTLQACTNSILSVHVFGLEAPLSESILQAQMYASIGVNAVPKLGPSPLFFSRYGLFVTEELPINLKGEKYLLSGLIHIDSRDNKLEHIALDILNTRDEVVDVVVAGLVTAEIDEPSTAVYEYSFWASFGETLTFIPRDARNSLERKILFYPRKHKVSVAYDGCQGRIAPFSGREGLYIEGSVSPPTSRVHIRILAERTSEVSNLKQGDTAIETFTDEGGLFLAGPLYDDISYTITATKPGYSIKHVGRYSFSCQKLGQISVKIYFSEDGNEPLPPILLSLSGEDGYRNNSVTGVSGVFLFADLFPGSYYLRPLLKEYAFYPAAEAINLASGESKDVVFNATRVAYSALGRITSLAGLPKGGVSVEARAESRGFYEETVADISGNYRLRGLYPETSYTIKVGVKSELGSTFMERASPESFSIETAYEDIKNLDFVIFERPDTIVLSGHVERKRIPELLLLLLPLQINVEIRPSNEPSRIESVFPLPISNFFQVKDLPKGKYSVQLRLAAPSVNYAFTSEIVEVDLESRPRVHVGPLSYTVDANHKQMELSPTSLYPLVVGISVIALFMSVPRLQDLYQGMIEMSGKKDTKKSMSRKKVT